jgi:biopolymer transport protein ExbD
MIKITERKNSKTEGINISPLIDLIFILLIFFIVTAAFISESAISVQRPAAESSTIIEHETLNIYITKNNNIYIENHPVSIIDLKGIIKEKNFRTSNLSVLIIADENVSTGQLIKIVDECKKNGIENISIATDNTI